MIPTDEDAFLPTNNDRIRAQIKELKVRLAHATEKRKTLKRQIIEEDLSYVVVSKITEGIKDPTRAQAHELEGLQKEIFEQLLSTAEECTVHEIISYHRLGGRTVFNFGKHYFGIRLETFYNKAYKEPYYILFLRKNIDRIEKPEKVDKHTVPKFVPVEVLAARFLPNNMETFLRIVHDCVQAFVSRRELINDIEKLSANITIQYKSSSCTKVEFKVESFNDMPVIVVTMLFKNYASAFPTDIKVKNFDSRQEEHDYSQLEQDLLFNDIVQVFTRFVGEAPIIMDRENNELDQNINTTIEDENNENNNQEHANAKEDSEMISENDDDNNNSTNMDLD